VTAAGRSRRSMVAAVLVPALAAFTLVLLLFAPSRLAAPTQVAHRSPSRLAQLADSAPAFRPIVLHGRRTVLGTGPAGPISTGARPGTPSRMSIPSLHVDAPMEPVTATPAGDIAVPQIGRAGWFDAGPRPGEPGRAVVIGHIDGATRPGVFQHVPEIATGAEVIVKDHAGALHRFRVVGKTQVAKSQFPASEVYGPANGPVLVLVTCGGLYVPGLGYSDNVIVYARGVSA
jgi:hypothetical protein